MKAKSPSFWRFLPAAALGVALVGVTSSPSIQEKPVETAFLWQVDGTEAPSYLFGTIHAGVSAAALPPVVASSLARSRAFVMETIPKPEMVARAVVGGVLPMDFELAEKAAHREQSVYGLESLQFQRNLFQELAGAENVAAVTADDTQAVASLTGAYRKGDLAEIEAQLFASSDAHFRDKLLTRRNHRWVRQLESGLTRGGLFVAVGVGHYPGQFGLLQLLTERGLKPARVV